MGENVGPGLLGCIIGFFLAGVLGFVSSRILWHWGRVTDIWRPQTTVLTTDRTPWQVVVEGCRSLLVLLGILILLVIFLSGAIAIFGWEEVVAFVMSVAQP